MDRHAKDRTVFTWCDGPLADWIERSLAGLPVEVYRAGDAEALFAIPYFIAIVDGRRLAGIAEGERNTWSCLRLNDPSSRVICPECGDRTARIHYPATGDPASIRRLFAAPEYTPPVYLVNPRAMKVRIPGVTTRRWPTQLSPSPPRFVAWLRDEVERARLEVVAWRRAYAALMARTDAEAAAVEPAGISDTVPASELLTEKRNRRMVMLIHNIWLNPPKMATVGKARP